MKLNLLEFSHQRDWGGTDKHSELMMKYYDRDKFNLFSCSYVRGPRLKWIEDNKIPNCTTENDVELINWIKSNKIDIVHLYRGGWTEGRDIALLKMAKVPVIIEQNCFAAFDPSGNRFDISAHIFCSKISQEIYKRNAGNDYDESKCAMIYCPIETELYDKCQIDYSQQTFGRFSRNDIKKWDIISINSLPLIKKELPDAKFHVIGLPEEFMSLIFKLNVQDMVVAYNPFQNDAEQIEFLNKISVFAHSSIIGESFGNTIAESMAAGMPIVSHYGGDSAQGELITNGYNGYVVNQEDVQGYADRIIYLLKNPDVKDKMGKLSKQRAKDWFDPKNTVKQFEDLYIKMWKRKIQ